MRKKTLADRPERHEVTQYVIVDVLPYRVNEDRPGGTPFANDPSVAPGILGPIDDFLAAFLFLAFVSDAWLLLIPRVRVLPVPGLLAVERATDD